MSNQVYKKETYVIFPVKNGYIVYNLKKDFITGHSHLRNYSAAKTAIDLALKKKIPKSTSFYYLQTLQRISDDETYINTIDSLIDVRYKKGEKEKYLNKNYIRKNFCLR